MAGNYTVKQGDFMAKIAHAFGFANYRTVWNDPNNAQLKQLRQDPDVLLPGDVVYVPDPAKREEQRSTDKLHTFKKKVPPLDLEIILENMYEKPIAQAACTLSIDGQSQQVTTDGSGLLKQKILPTAHDGSLTIPDAATPIAGLNITLKIGDLDPVTEFSGQVTRLRNLGYLLHGDEIPDQTAFEAAVEEFQCEAGISVDGICGPATQAKLKTIYGS